MDVRAGGLIVSIILNGSRMKKPSQDLLSHGNLRWKGNNFDGRVLGDYNQFGHVPILDFEYDEDGSTVS